MVGIIILLVLIVIGSFALLLSIFNKISSQREVIQSLGDKIHQLSEQLSKLSPYQKEEPKEERIYKKPIVPPVPEPTVTPKDISKKDVIREEKKAEPEV